MNTEMKRFRKIAKVMLTMRDGFILDGWKLEDTINDENQLSIKLTRRNSNDLNDVLLMYFDKTKTSLTISKNGKVRNTLY